MTHEKAIDIFERMLSHYQGELYTDSEKEMKEALELGKQALETGEVYMTAKDYNLFLEGYKQGKKDFERPEGEWIPVSERLPEENGEYLVTREAYIDRENRNMIFVRDIAWFTTNYELNNGFHKANTVIAWMPLPELYEEGGTE